MCEGDDRKWYLTGIASFGHTGCGVPFKYGVYTRVVSHVDWISRVTGLSLTQPRRESTQLLLKRQSNRQTDR